MHSILTNWFKKTATLTNFTVYCQSEKSQEARKAASTFTLCCISVTFICDLEEFERWRNQCDVNWGTCFSFFPLFNSSSKVPVKPKVRGPNLVRHDILWGPVNFIDKLQHDFICTGSQPYLPAEEKKACWWWLPLVLAIKLLT